MEDQKLISLEDLKKSRRLIRNVNIEHKEKLNRLDKVAVWITENVGTMGFFVVIFVWTVVWLSWNIFAPEALRFDSYPAFVLWLFISNMIQIFLLPLIMVGQNLQGRHAEARAQSDFEVNIKAEQEVEVILAHLEHQSKLITKILDKIGSQGK